MPGAGKAALAGENKRLSASDAYHNSGPHFPQRSEAWAAECRRRRAVEAGGGPWRGPRRARTIGMGECR